MKHSSAIIHLLLALAVLGLATAVVHRSGQTDPARRAGNDQSVRRQLEQLRPEVLLIGNSMLEEGVEPEVLGNLMGRRVVKLAIHGSASALWFLLLKNVVALADPRPPVVVIFFRDHYLTEPSYRATGALYQQRIDAFATDDEPVLDRLAYQSEVHPVDWALDRHWALYRRRDRIRTLAEDQFQHGLAGYLSGQGPDEIDDALNHVFDDTNFDPKLATAAQLEAEGEAEVSRYDFNAVVEDSFLPHMISITRKAEVKLILVRIKRRRDIELPGEPPYIQRYIQDLTEYLRENDVPLIDFTHEPAIELEHYAAGDHLSRNTGRPLFTRLLAEGLRPLLDEEAEQYQTPGRGD